MFECAHVVECMCLCVHVQSKTSQHTTGSLDYIFIQINLLEILTKVNVQKISTMFDLCRLR